MERQRQVLAIEFETPFGYAAVIYQAGPFELLRVLLPRPGKKDLWKGVTENIRGRKGTHPTAVKISQAIRTYLNGGRLSKAWPFWKWLRMDHLTNLQRAVLVATTAIPYGEVRSYQEIAQAVGRPRACRSVGSALAKNPFPLLIPCHRVIRSDSTIGQFGGGTELKRKLIQLESLRS